MTTGGAYMYYLLLLLLLVLSTVSQPVNGDSDIDSGKLKAHSKRPILASSGRPRCERDLLEVAY